jgi:hypothetical protein
MQNAQRLFYILLHRSETPKISNTSAKRII